MQFRGRQQGLFAAHCGPLDGPAFPGETEQREGFQRVFALLVRSALFASINPASLLLELILKEWLRSFTPNTNPFDGSFISSLAGYLIDVFLCFAFHT